MTNKCEATILEQQGINGQVDFAEAAQEHIGESAEYANEIVDNVNEIIPCENSYEALNSETALFGLGVAAKMTLGKDLAANFSENFLGKLQEKDGKLEFPDAKEIRMYKRLKKDTKFSDSLSRFINIINYRMKGGNQEDVLDKQKEILDLQKLFSVVDDMLLKAAVQSVDDISDGKSIIDLSDRLVGAYVGLFSSQDQVYKKGNDVYRIVDTQWDGDINLYRKLTKDSFVLHYEYNKEADDICLDFDESLRKGEQIKEVQYEELLGNSYDTILFTIITKQGSDFSVIIDRNNGKMQRLAGEAFEGKYTHKVEKIGLKKFFIGVESSYGNEEIIENIVVLDGQDGEKLLSKFEVPEESKDAYFSAGGILYVDKEFAYHDRDISLEKKGIVLCDIHVIEDGSQDYVVIEHDNTIKLFYKNTGEQIINNTGPKKIEVKNRKVSVYSFEESRNPKKDAKEVLDYVVDLNTNVTHIPKKQSFQDTLLSKKQDFKEHKQNSGQEKLKEEIREGKAGFVFNFPSYYEITEDHVGSWWVVRGIFDEGYKLIEKIDGRFNFRNAIDLIGSYDFDSWMNNYLNDEDKNIFYYLENGELKSKKYFRDNQHRYPGKESFHIEGDKDFVYNYETQESSEEEREPVYLETAFSRFREEYINSSRVQIFEEDNSGGEYTVFEGAHDYEKIIMGGKLHLPQLGKKGESDNIIFYREIKELCEGFFCIEFDNGKRRIINPQLNFSYDLEKGDELDYNRERKNSSFRTSIVITKSGGRILEIDDSGIIFELKGGEEKRSLGIFGGKIILPEYGDLEDFYRSDFFIHFIYKLIGREKNNQLSGKMPELVLWGITPIIEDLEIIEENHFDDVLEQYSFGNNKEKSENFKSVLKLKVIIKRLKDEITLRKVRKEQEDFSIPTITTAGIKYYYDYEVLTMGKEKKNITIGNYTLVSQIATGRRYLVDLNTDIKAGGIMIEVGEGEVSGKEDSQMYSFSDGENFIAYYIDGENKLGMLKVSNTEILSLFDRVRSAIDGIYEF